MLVLVSMFSVLNFVGLSFFSKEGGAATFAASLESTCGM